MNNTKKEIVVILLIWSLALSSFWWYLISIKETWSVAVWAFMIWTALACVLKWTNLLNK